MINKGHWIIFNSCWQCYARNKQCQVVICLLIIQIHQVNIHVCNQYARLCFFNLFKWICQTSIKMCYVSFWVSVYSSNYHGSFGLGHLNPHILKFTIITITVLWYLQVISFYNITQVFLHHGGNPSIFIFLWNVISVTLVRKSALEISKPLFHYFAQYNDIRVSLEQIQIWYQLNIMLWWHSYVQMK